MKDPVFLMDVGLRDAGAMSVHQDRAYYFCCSDCQRQFVDDPEKYRDVVKAERLSIGVMGSASSTESNEASAQAHILGEVISVGISPALSLDEHIHKYDSLSGAFDLIIYTGSGLMGREVVNIRSSDMVVIAGGRSGTLGEFSIAYDEGKLIGVLKNSGGITDSLPDIIDRIDKDTGAELIYENDPEKLVDLLIASYEERHFRKPSCFCSSP